MFEILETFQRVNARALRGGVGGCWSFTRDGGRGRGLFVVVLKEETRKELDSEISISPTPLSIFLSLLSSDGGKTCTQPE